MLDLTQNYFEDEEFDQKHFEQLKGNIEFLGCSFQGVNIPEQSLRGFKFIECEFKNCNLSNVGVTGATFRDYNFSETKLVGVNWTTVNNFSDIQFESCILDYSVFQELNLTAIKAEKSSLKEVDFSGANLSKGSFVDSDFNGSNFNRANLEGSDFRRAINYLINPNESKIKKAKFSAPEVMNLLKSFEIKIE